MRNKKPPFEITNQMIGYVAEIAELVGKLSAVSSLSANPTLRRSNRIRTIHGSLAIEQNTLSLEQVTAVLNGLPIPRCGAATGLEPSMGLWPLSRTPFPWSR